jgi:hypothetical protein
MHALCIGEIGEIAYFTAPPYFVAHLRPIF